MAKKRKNVKRRPPIPPPDPVCYLVSQIGVRIRRVAFSRHLGAGDDRTWEVSALIAGPNLGRMLHETGKTAPDTAKALMRRIERHLEELAKKGQAGNSVEYPSSGIHKA